MKSNRPKELQYPFDSEVIRKLKVGDRVILTGRIFTGRDRLHKYLFEGGEIPVDLANGGIYHCGPIVIKKDGGWQVRAAGPTTSIREEPYMGDIIAKNHLRVIIGKGGMGDATAKACAKYTCVYLQLVGGAAVSVAQCIESVAGVFMIEEFGPAEALWELQVFELPALVAIDSKGKSLYKRISASSKRAFRKLTIGT